MLAHGYHCFCLVLWRLRLAESHSTLRLLQPGKGIACSKTLHLQLFLPEISAARKPIPSAACKPNAVQALLERVRQKLDADSFVVFKQQTGNFARGTLDAPEFHASLVSLGLTGLVPDMAALLPDVNEGMDAWGNIITICCIIRYHHKRQTKSDVAKRWIERIVRAGLELLSDSDDGALLEHWLISSLICNLLLTYHR